MKTTGKKRKTKNVLARLKVWLLQGKSITQLEALRLFGTTRLAEFIRQLRHEHNWQIKTEMVSRNGSWYGKYTLVKAPKVNRIKSGAYRGDQGATMGMGY